jgi:hypothetical protein
VRNAPAGGGLCHIQGAAGEGCRPPLGDAEGSSTQQAERVGPFSERPHGDCERLPATEIIHGPGRSEAACSNHGRQLCLPEATSVAAVILVLQEMIASIDVA